MLVLTRKQGEKLIIGEEVTVTVLSIKANQIRFGIDAPRHVKVHREEIYQRILKEKKVQNGSDRISARVPGVKVKVPVETLSISDKS